MNDHLVLAKIEHSHGQETTQSALPVYWEMGGWDETLRGPGALGENRNRERERGKRDGVSSITETDNQ